jgi:hypothetical protein
VIALVTPTIDLEVKIAWSLSRPAVIRAVLNLNGASPLTDLALCDAPALLLVSPVIPRIASASDCRLSPASQQTSQSEETQQTPASPILSDHYGSGKGRAGWIHRPVLQIVRWLLGEADSR